MSNYVIARKDPSWIVNNLAPDVCLTPLGGTNVPVPYSTTANLGEAESTAATVFVNGNPAVLFGSTFVPHTPGSEPGTSGGVKSGTTALTTRPQQHSSSVRIEGKYIVRDVDLYGMNGT